MAGRSVGEVLPRPFDDLDVADVELIVANEGESLFVELKERAQKDALAKSCAAFANTMGGLLIIGVVDGTGALVGIDDTIGEPQVWVKDILRERVVPLPPFRARHLDLSGDRWLLLVLVEESSTTPHLLTRQGAIYVRNPGSSDPRPIADQGLLLELTRRGRETREHAISRARAALWEIDVTQLEWTEGTARFPLCLSLASTGVSQGFEDLLFSSSGRELMDAVLPPHPNERFRQGVDEVVRQATRTLVHYVESRPFASNQVNVVGVARDGVASFLNVLYRTDDDIDHRIDRDQVSSWLAKSHGAGRELLLSLGAHGDLRIALLIAGGRGVTWRVGSPNVQLLSDVVVETWSGLDLDEDREREVLRRVEREVGRALGFPPDED